MPEGFAYREIMEFQNSARKHFIPTSFILHFQKQEKQKKKLNPADKSLQRRDFSNSSKRYITFGIKGFLKKWIYNVGLLVILLFWAGLPGKHS